MWANQTDQSKTAVPARAAKLYDTTIVSPEANILRPAAAATVIESQVDRPG